MPTASPGAEEASPLPATGTTASAASAPIVSIENVSKRFGRTLALDGLSVSIQPEEVFALLGPNGAGKSTLIHILCTILRPDSGTATICGFDIRKKPLQARKHLGVVFQEPSLDSRLTVEENLEFHGMIYNVPRKLRRQRIEEMLEMVELSDTRHRLVRTLSPGMKRRVEIARALIHDAKVVILDEPTIGLDAQSRERIWAYLAKARSARNLTLIVTTHYIDEVDACDRVCIVDHGKVLALDTPDALRTAHGRELVRVRARTPEIAAAILERFPSAKTRTTGEIVIEGAGTGETVMDALLESFGSGIGHLSFERPTLESAFLNLTGHEIRDEKPSARATLSDEPRL